MKPPVLPKPPPFDPRPGLWTVGAIFAVAGLVTMLIDNPLVPLTQEFQLIPLGLGGVVGAALLRNRFGPPALAAYALVILWLIWQTIALKTTPGLVLLSAGLFNLTRALLLTVSDD